MGDKKVKKPGFLGIESKSGKASRELKAAQAAKSDTTKVAPKFCKGGRVKAKGK